MAADATHVARQLRYEKKNRTKGKCPKCGKKTGGFFYCKKHRKQDNIIRLKRYYANGGSHSTKKAA